MRRKNFKIFLSVVAICAFLAIVLDDTLMGETVNLDVDCLGDKAHIALQSHYEYFAKNTELRHNVMIFFSLIIDSLLLIFFAIWIIKGGSWRFMIALALIYIFKWTQAATFKIRLPVEGNIWDYPGVPSLVVEYGSENDYFFN